MTRQTDAAFELLFGLLALHTGLIDQAALLGAFHAWVRDKGRPMAEVLAGQGGLDPSEVALLEGLARKHLERHGGDARMSLSSLGAGQGTREGLAGVNDAELSTILADVGPDVTTDSRDDRTASFAVGRTTSEGQRFRVLRPHAEGGLGAVFVALDTELHREVALKEIRDRYADDPVSRARFLLEAEVTGGLEHPGVVPVYGLGSHADGRPYYAMRFIRGDSLKQALTRFHAEGGPGRDPGAHGLELRKLLRRFLDVCNVIEYAHGRGVLHRDIKPGNVMVGKYGETLVVDWGLAKAVGRDDPRRDPGEMTLVPSSSSGEAQTVPGSALGTPGYMSPEQAAGELGRLGPASDLYSLGATLYCLLTGQAPHQGPDVPAVLAVARTGTFPRPRQLRPGLPPALEAVCLKALALRPEDRYASPRALADDLERWMADEPVTAYRDPAATRAARWARRHRPLVAGAAGLLLTATAALAAGTVLLGRANTRTEAHFATALGQTNKMLQLTGNDLATVPGAEAARWAMARRVIDSFRDLLALRPSDPPLRSAAASAYREAGNIDRTLGRFDEARDYYSRATELLAGLAAKFPLDDDHRLNLAAVRIDVGELLRMNGRLHDAEGPYRNALADLAVLRARRPGDPDVARTEATGLLNLSLIQYGRGAMSEAADAAVKAAALFEGLAGRPRAQYTDRVLHVAALVNHGIALRARGEARGAEESLGRAVQVARSLAEAPTGDSNPAFLLAASLCERGELFAADPRRLGEARADYEEAAGLLRPLVRVSEAPDYRERLAIALDGLGVCSLRSGKLGQARAECLEATSHLAVLLASRDLPDYHSALGRTLGNLGRVALAEGLRDQALDLFRRAVRQQGLALDKSPESWTDARLLERHLGDIDDAGRWTPGAPAP